MQSPVQRRRQLESLRPRQTLNDVNVGAAPAQMTATAETSQEISEEARKAAFARACAARDLV